MNNLTIDKDMSKVIKISSIDYNFFLLFKNNVTVEEKLQKQINKIFDICFHR
jgi:hypothetical protein